MNILLKMLGLSILMILGFAGILIGSMLLCIGRTDDFILGRITLVGGIIAGPFSLYGMIKLNKLFQEKELKMVLEQPEQILFRFTHNDDKKEVIIARQALFIGKSHYPFNSFYEKLVALQQEGNELIFEFKANGVTQNYTKTKKIEVPLTLTEQTRIWVEDMQKQLTV